MTMEHFNPQAGHMPDSGGEGLDGASLEQIDLVGTGSARKRVSDATIVLAGTLLVGAGILTGMRWLGSQSSHLGVDKAIEKTVNEFLGRSNKETARATSAAARDSDAMLNSLTDDRTEAQVPLEQVKKNPFVLRWSRSVSTPTDDGSAAESAAAREAARLAQLRLNLDRDVKRMRLSSIMGQPGKRVAVLDNLVVQVGDIVKDLFTVTDITAFEVVLNAEGMEFRKSLKD